MWQIAPPPPLSHSDYSCKHSILTPPCLATLLPSCKPVSDSFKKSNMFLWTSFPAHQNGTGDSQGGDDGCRAGQGAGRGGQRRRAPAWRADEDQGVAKFIWGEVHGQTDSSLWQSFKSFKEKKTFVSDFSKSQATFPVPGCSRAATWPAALVKQACWVILGIWPCSR